jgi:hypothetical protein
LPKIEFEGQSFVCSYFDVFDDVMATEQKKIKDHLFRRSNKEKTYLNRF